MATFLIPVDCSQEEFRQVSSLDGVPYVFEFTWSRRSESWYLDLYLQTDTDPEPISTGLKLTIGWPLLIGNVSDIRPPGQLLVVDSTGEGDPGRLDLGTRCKLYYINETV